MPNRFWSVYAARYDAIWDNALTRDVARQVLEVVPHESVLEVGAGTGLITREFVRLGLHVRATEPQPDMRAQLMRRLPDLPVTDESCADLAPSATSRTVIAVNVLHLVKDPQSALAHLRRAAGPRGTVIVVTPHPRATLRLVARGMGSAGAPRAEVRRFWANHLALVPVTVAPGAGMRPLPHGWATGAVESRTLHGVQVLHVFNAEQTCRSRMTSNIADPSARLTRDRLAAMRGTCG